MKQSQQGFSLERFLPYKLMKAAAHVSDSLAQIYENEFGLSRAEWRIMASLGTRDAMNAKALVVETHMDKVRVSRTLALLESKGLINRVKDSEDLRASRLQLSDKGQTLYKTLLPKAMAWEAEMLSGISPEDYQCFLSTLATLLAKSETNPSRAIKEP